MDRARRSYLPGLIVVLFLVGFVAPPGSAAAQEFDCPEGLVYNDAAEICLPPEDVPAEEEPVQEEPVDGEDASSGVSGVKCRWAGAIRSVLEVPRCPTPIESC